MKYGKAYLVYSYDSMPYSDSQDCPRFVTFDENFAKSYCEKGNALALEEATKEDGYVGYLLNYTTIEVVHG